MKTFLVEFESPNNIFKGKRVVRAPNIKMAQEIFFIWISNQPVFEHMWRLSFSFEEVEE